MVEVGGGGGRVRENDDAEVVAEEFEGVDFGVFDAGDEVTGDSVERVDVRLGGREVALEVTSKDFGSGDALIDFSEGVSVILEDNVVSGDVGFADAGDALEGGSEVGVSSDEETEARGVAAGADSVID